MLYAINVFVTFSLTEMGMSSFWVRERKVQRHWMRNLMVHGTGLTLCLSILVVTTVEKFKEGGWLTFLITASLIAVCFLIKGHYNAVGRQIRDIDAILSVLPTNGHVQGLDRLDPGRPVAALLVSGYGGLEHPLAPHHPATLPNTFTDVLFVSTGVVDSGHFKGKAELEALKAETEEGLKRYVAFANGLGLNADYRFVLGAEVVDGPRPLCGAILKEFPPGRLLPRQADLRQGARVLPPPPQRYRVRHPAEAPVRGDADGGAPIRITMS